MPTVPLQVVPGIFLENHNSGERFPTAQGAWPSSEGWCPAQGSPLLQSGAGTDPALPAPAPAGSIPSQGALLRDLAQP